MCSMRPRQEFQLRASYGMDEVLIAAIKDRHIRMGETMISQAALQRSADASLPTSGRIVVARPRRHSDAPGSVPCWLIPLLGADRIVGALVVRRKAPGEFPQSTINLLQTFAAQSVLAIQNARLFER